MPEPRRRTVATAVAALIALPALVAACSSGSNDPADRVPSVDGGVVRLSPDQRPAALQLTGTAIDGSRIDLATLRGKPVVINIWGSWCAPCREEAPDLVTAHEQLKPQGVAFLGINTGRDGVAEAQAYERTYGITYPSVLDKSGAALLALRGVVAPSPPSTLVLDAAGRVAARVSGGVDTTTLVGLVTDLEKSG